MICSEINSENEKKIQKFNKALEGYVLGGFRVFKKKIK